jgi:N-acetylglutamate synthase-like GNAT family acetyltransferase
MDAAPACRDIGREPGDGGSSRGLSGWYSNLLPQKVAVSSLSLEIAYLADYPDDVDAIARWLHAEWGWFTPGSTLDDRRAKLAGHLNRDALPLALVAREQGRPVGTAALRVHDMDTRPHLTPWLASVYVHPWRRGRGLGTHLAARIEAEAVRLRFDRLYLVTFDQSPFYAARGWTLHERTTYRTEPVVVMQKHLESKAQPA